MLDHNMIELKQEILRLRHDFNRQNDITNRQLSTLTDQIQALNVKMGKVEVYLDTYDKRISLIEKLGLTALMSGLSGLSNSIFNIIKLS